MKRSIRVLLPAALIALLVGNLAAQEIFREERGVYSTRSLTSTVSLETGGRIEIRSVPTLRGMLTVVAADQEEVSLNYVKKAQTAERSDAVDYIDLIAVELESYPGVIILEMRAPNPAPWRGTDAGIVEVELVVPIACEVSIDAALFDIGGIGPFSSFLVPASLGRLEVENVSDKLDLSTSNRRVKISNISGEVKASTSNSTLIATDIASHEGRAVFRNEGGDIKIQGAVGGLDVKNRYGRIDVADYRPAGRKNYVRGFHGPIMLEVMQIDGGQLIVSNRYEDVEIRVPDDISAVFSLVVEQEGRIEVSSFPFTPDLVQTNRLTLTAGEGSALINGSVRGKGNIYVRGVPSGEEE